MPVSVGPPSFVAARTPEKLSAWKLKQGRWAATDDETVLDRTTAERVGYKIGDRVTIVGVDGAVHLKITTAGGVRGLVARRRSGRRHDPERGRQDHRPRSAATTASPSRGQGVSALELRDRIKRALGTQPLTVRTAAESAAKQADDLKTQLGFLQPVLLAFGLIALFVGQLRHRQHVLGDARAALQELALLRALGATRGQVTRSVLTESVLIGVVCRRARLLGGLVGLAPGVL